MNSIFFINPPSPDKVPVIRDAYRSGRRSKEGMIWPQTTLAQLAAMVDDVVKPFIFDCIGQGIGYKKLERLIKKYQPKYVVFEVIPATLTNDLKTAEIAKKYGAITIAIGAHAVSAPKQLLEECYWLDYVIPNEADVTLREFVYTVENKKDIPIKGLMSRRGYTGDRQFTDLDLLPIPRYDLLPKYVMPFFGRFMFVIAGRGCPFDCIFCRERLVFKRTVRMRRSLLLAEEVRRLKRQGIKNIMFHAGDFTANKKWVMDFCKVITPLKVRWACNTHIKTIDEEMAIAMKQAGCWMVAPGIESGSDEVLDFIHKETDVKTIYDKVTMLHEVGLKVWGYFMLGFPIEDEKMLQRTIDFACMLPLDIAHFGMATPYYGTKFYDMCVKNDWLAVTKWEDYDQNSSASVEYPNLSGDTIKQYIRKAYKQFYLRKPYIKRLLIEGLKTNPLVLLRILRGML